MQDISKSEDCCQPYLPATKKTFVTKKNIKSIYSW